MIKLVVSLMVVAVTITAQNKLPAGAWVNDDFVSIRTEPSTEGNKIGVLYKKMKVKVLAKSKEMVTIGKNTDYWYKVKRKNLSGWAFGTFIDFIKVPKDESASYYADPGLDWFYKRYSYSTWEELDLDFKEFTLEEYRSLITAAVSDARVTWLLYNTIYSSLENEKDALGKPPFPYLKELLLSPEFLARIVYSQSYDCQEGYSYGYYSATNNIFKAVSEYVKDKEKLFLAITKNGPAVFEYLPADLQKNEPFLIKVIIKNPDNFAYINSKFAENEDAVKKILNGLWETSGKNKELYPIMRYKIVSRLHAKLTAKYYSYTPNK